MVAIYNSEETFFDADQIFRQAEIEVDSMSIAYVFDDMPIGEYAVTLYHDEDNDGEFDMLMGFIPKEDYACSNGATGMFGPPKWEKAQFEVKGNEIKQIAIKL